MTAIRKYVFATVMAFAALNLVPTLASAESRTHGQFKLTHEVHWQKALVPAGEYRFTYESDGASGVLTLTKISAPRAGFIFLVTDTDEAPIVGGSCLTLENRAEGRYVSAMLLLESGTTLHFRVPANAEKRLARAATTVASSGQ